MPITFGLGSKSAKPKSSASRAAPKHRSALAPESDEEDEPERKPQTLDEEALDALLGNKKDKKSTLVIESASNETFKARATSDHAFKSDVYSRPDEAGLADYENVPTEGFGLALLNGMGFGDGEGKKRFKGVTTTPRNKIRPTSLGIGAAAAPNGIELGAWGKGDKKSNRIDRSVDYSKRKNPETGEIITEQEYQRMLQNNQTLVTGESRARPKDEPRDRNRGDSERHRGARLLENGDNASSSHRNGERDGRRSERSRSPGSRRHRHRDERPDSDRSSRRDRERDRDRHRDSRRGDDDKRRKDRGDGRPNLDDGSDDSRSHSRHERRRDEKRHRPRD